MSLRQKTLKSTGTPNQSSIIYMFQRHIRLIKSGPYLLAFMVQVGMVCSVGIYGRLMQIKRGFFSFARASQAIRTVSIKMWVKRLSGARSERYKKSTAFSRECF